jgi:hypothetical protein
MRAAAALLFSTKRGEREMNLKICIERYRETVALLSAELLSATVLLLW